MRAVIALVVTVACLGCGSTRPAPGDQEWVANTRGIIRQLQADMSQVSDVGTPVEAARTLNDESRLYAALVVYTDFGGCRHMVAALGRAPSRFRRVGRELDRACANLQRSSALFTSAVSGENARTMAAAARAARRAAGPLLQGELALGR